MKYTTAYHNHSWTFTFDDKEVRGIVPAGVLNKLSKRYNERLVAAGGKEEPQLSFNATLELILPSANVSWQAREKLACISTGTAQDWLNLGVFIVSHAPVGSVLASTTMPDVSEKVKTAIFAILPSEFWSEVTEVASKDAVQYNLMLAQEEQEKLREELRRKQRVVENVSNWRSLDKKSLERLRKLFETLLESKTLAEEEKEHLREELQWIETRRNEVLDILQDADVGYGSGPLPMWMRMWGYGR